MKNPIQPLYKDQDGDVRFKANEIVKQLCDFAATHGMDLNYVAAMNVSNDDQQQFAQLLGFKLSHYSELRRHVDDDAYRAASTMYEEGLTEDKARIASLEHELFMVRSMLREPVARLFGIHPDDLKIPNTAS